MATLASAYPIANPEDLASAFPRAVALTDATEVGGEPRYERGVYRPSRRSGPLAFCASAGVMLAALAALATLNIVGRHEATQRLTVVEMKELDTTPPPPPPERLEQPIEQRAQVFVPKPMIELPSPGPTQVALDTPPPIQPTTQPPAVTSPKIAAPAATAPAAPAAPSSDPVEGGDLSSQVLSAKPPAYPLDARRRKEQGTVKLMVLVGPDGKVSDVKVSGSSGSAFLDRAALSAVKRWRWTPQKKNGVPVAVRGYVTIPFVLV